SSPQRCPSIRSCSPIGGAISERAADSFHQTPELTFILETERGSDLKSVKRYDWLIGWMPQPQKRCECSTPLLVESADFDRANRVVGCSHAPGKLRPDRTKSTNAFPGHSQVNRILRHGASSFEA